MLPRVLSATACVWVDGHDAVAQALEMTLPSRVGAALARGLSEVASGPRTHSLVLVAWGSRCRFQESFITVAGCAAPVVRIVGMVTTAAVPRVQGHLLREMSRDESRDWLFIAGADPLAICASSGIYSNPVVEQAGFIAVPSDAVRERRKEILGFQ